MALPHSINILKYPARYQFGQPNAPCGGSSCCTDTCIQMIVEYYKEEHHGLSLIRKRAQAKTNFDERPCTGINHIEVLNALASFGLGHYKVAFGADALTVWRKLSVGPVLVGVHYGSYPTRKGKCNSNNAEYAGKTDCGFNGAHAVLAVHKRNHTVNGKTHRDIFIRDPDHNSPARPEKPPYDIITRGQLNRAMKNLPRHTKFTNTYIIYPTKKKTL